MQALQGKVYVFDIAPLTNGWIVLILGYVQALAMNPIMELLLLLLGAIPATCAKMSELQGFAASEKLGRGLLGTSVI